MVGADVSVQTLLRRLGPRRWRGRPTPDKVIDWAAIQPFGGEVANVRLRASHDGLERLRPAAVGQQVLRRLGGEAGDDIDIARRHPSVAAAWKTLKFIAMLSLKVTDGG